MVKNAYGCNNLGDLYYSGLGVDGQDYEEAANLYRQACDGEYTP